MRVFVTWYCCTMKVSLNGLKRFVDLKCSLSELEEAFVNLGFEVESIQKQGFDPQDFVVAGKILEFQKHPNADRLNVCRVDVGDGEIRQIVCGAKNFKQGDIVPVALPGAILPGDFKIKKSNLRGIKSEGMMCSGRELGLGDDHSGLLILDSDTILGTKIHDLFPDYDVILDFELTANRGDALSYYGVARELAAWFDLPLKPVDVQSIPSVNEQDLELSVESEKCEVYAAIKIEGVNIAESPEWIKRDLSAVGIATVNNIVDITNWVMLNYGQPLHAFDADKAGNSLIIREAKNGEEIEALNAKKYTLSNSDLVIANKESLLSIAGIIGGENSKIDQTTTTIILEGACFDHASIRCSSKKLQINTDSAYRYARHVDGFSTVSYLDLAANMILEIAGGKIKSKAVQEKNISCQPKTIDLQPQFVGKILGFELATEEIKSILQRLQYPVTVLGDGMLRVTSPSYRWDVTRPIDLVEEILRIYGVRKIPTKSTVCVTVNSQDALTFIKQQKVSNWMAAKGFLECYNYSFRDGLEGELSLENPLLEGQKKMRSSLIAGLIDNLKFNIKNDNGALLLFECGRVVKKIHDSYYELFSVAFLMPQEDLKEHWEGATHPTILNAKSILKEVSKLVTEKDLDSETFQSLEDLYFMGEGFSGKWCDLSHDLCEFHVGLLKPEWIEDIGIPVLAAEVIVACEELKNSCNTNYIPFSNFPSAKRDIAIIVSKNCPGSEAVKIVGQIANQSANGIFSEIKVKIFDVYEGDNLPSDKKSLAMHLEFKNNQRTPLDTEIDAVFEKLVSGLKMDNRVELRG